MSPPSPLPIQEGDVLAGKYRVERVLGSGGMGIVVAARHMQLDQLVALKFVRDEAISEAGAVERFLREARSAVKLKSEHVAKVLDVGTLESGAPYMVMEFLEGLDLGQVLERDGPAPIDTATEWVLQACEAVAEAHAAGIVHRDLKPQNLFLARTVGGVGIKVLDFGVSKSMTSVSGGFGSLTRTRTMLGSPLYMAPEQMRSARDVNAAADVWALGVVLFELLTRRWPFEAETMPDLCLKVVSEAPLNLRLLRADVPEPLVGVIERCLSKDPKARYANAADLASALEPHVPVASRVLAARARFAMSAVNTPGPASSVVPSVHLAQTEVASSSDARTAPAPTPSAWGSGGERRMASPPRRRFAGILLALAGAAALAWVLFMHRAAPHPAPSAPLAVSTPPPSVAPPVAPAALPPALPVILEPLAASATAGPSSAPPQPAQPSPISSAHAVPTPRTAVRPPPTASKPSEKGDDDIPALR